MIGRLLDLAALVAVLGFVALSAPEAEAQQVSQTHRRLLMVGAYGAGYGLDAGDDADRARAAGGGGRLLVNLAPFSGPGNNLLDNAVLGFFLAGGSGDDFSVLHSGAELDLHFVHNPIGGFLDPFVSIGAGRFRIRRDAASGAEIDREDAGFALSPGFGVRIPLRGLFELRADAQDVIVFGSTLQGGTGERTTHNPAVSAGVQLRF